MTCLFSYTAMSVCYSLKALSRGPYDANNTNNLSALIRAINVATRMRITALWKQQEINFPKITNKMDFIKAEMKGVSALQIINLIVS